MGEADCVRGKSVVKLKEWIKLLILCIKVVQLGELFLEV